MAVETWSIKEIARTTGILDKTLSSRARALRKKGELPPVDRRTRAMYTYEQVTKLISKPVRPMKPRQAAIDVLKRKLLNDGYPINKKEAGQ
jgi:hypothetical protein